MEKDGMYKNEYIADIEWYYNMPSQPHRKQIIIDAYDSLEAENIVRQRYPNIIRCRIWPKEHK